MSSLAQSSIPRSVLSVLSEARQVYVAVDARDGPHVTPELYTWSGGRIWVPAATSTLKARVIEDGTRLAAAVIGRGSAVIVEGTAQVFDPRDPRTLVRADSTPRMARALVSFAARNAGDLLGFARDTIKGNSVSRVPQPRLVIGIEPDRIAFVENDHVAWHAGWPDTADAPESIDIPTGGTFGVVAFDGPKVAPARWFADENRAFVAVELLALQRISGGTAVAVVKDNYNAPGPGAKQGTLVRGEGTVGEDGWVLVEPRKTVEWDGTEMTRY